MRKLLSILLLFIGVISYSQITITPIHRSAASTCDGAGTVGATMVDITFTAGKLYILTVYSDSSNVFGTLSGVSETFTPLVQIGAHARKLAVYRMMPTSTTTTQDLTISWSFGTFPSYLSAIISEVSGVPIGDNGGNAVKQVVIDSNTSANPVLTFSAGMGSGSAVLTVFENNRSPFNGTPESGWTEDGDGGCATFPASSYIVGTYIMHRTSTNDNTPTVTATSSTWRGVGLLFDTPRRTIITN